MIKSATDTGFEYYVNTINTIAFAYNISAKKITRIYKSDWASIKMDVIKEDKKGEVKSQDMDWDSIIKEDNDIFTVIKPIASTMKPAGYFREFVPTIGVYQQYLNEYLNGEAFTNAKAQQLLDINPIEILETECPNITILLRNLFFNESNEILQNFLNWLANIAYKDDRQDIFWLFKGTDEDNQGQGAGKGVFRDLMRDLFSGLVVSVNNQSYKNNFNSPLMNMKLVIFDEVNFKSLSYEIVKDMTGSTILPIENKGKEIIMTDNVASWLFFTNEYDLLKKIIATDRRCFLIHPNPINDSLSKIVPNIEVFVKEIRNELQNFIKVLAHCELNVIRPDQLRTAAHKEYFTNQQYSQIADIKAISKFFTNLHDRESYFDFLKQLEKIDGNVDYSMQRFFIENEFIYYAPFLEIFDVCRTHKIASINNCSSQKAWKELREDLHKAKYEDYLLDKKSTINGQRIRIKENCMRSQNTDKSRQKKITNYIVNHYKNKPDTPLKAS